MISKKIFLGTLDYFVHNRKALTLHQMEQPFFEFNQCQCYHDRQVGYTITSTSNFFSNKEQKVNKIREDIQECDICILDVTSIDSNMNLPLLVGEVLIMCIEQAKRVILIHNQEKENYLKHITSHIKKENLLGVFSHDGKQFPEEVMKCLDDYYAKDSKYNRNSNVILDGESNIDIMKVLGNWIQEKELGFGFYHIFVNYDTIEIHYQGYNTPTLCFLTIDTSKLDLNTKLKIESQLREISDSTHIFMHISMNESHKYRRKMKK